MSQSSILQTQPSSGNVFYQSLTPPPQQNQQNLYYSSPPAPQTSSTIQANNLPDKEFDSPFNNNQVQNVSISTRLTVYPSTLLSTPIFFYYFSFYSITNQMTFRGFFLFALFS